MNVKAFLRDSIGAHAWRFERPLAPAYARDAGSRILIAFAAVGIGLMVALRYAFAAAGLHGGAANLAFVAAWLAAFLLAHRAFVRLPFAAVGMRAPADWSRRERLYFLEVVPLAAIVFAVMFREHLHALLDRYGIAGFVFFAVLGGVLWGVAQELVYRGWLQTELTRRWGAVAGLLAANFVFTFGPLHWDYLTAASGIRWSGLALIFAVGAVFGVIYARSGNVWIPAAMHGLWPPNMN